MLIVFLFCRILGQCHRGPGVSLGRILVDPSIELFLGEGGSQKGCIDSPPPPLKVETPPTRVTWQQFPRGVGGRRRANGTSRHIQHSPGTPTTGLRERGNDTSRSTGRSGRQNAATRRNMRREERVTVQGPVKKQQPDGMSHRGGSALLWPTRTGSPCGVHSPAVAREVWRGGGGAVECDDKSGGGVPKVPSNVASAGAHGNGIRNATDKSLPRSGSHAFWSE